VKRTGANPGRRLIRIWGTCLIFSKMIHCIDAKEVRYEDPY
jgi:hypothetical protein